MLRCNNIFSPFTDIIYGIIAGAGWVNPKLVPWSQAHAVIASATNWLTRAPYPVCIVQCCPIAPFPGSLYLHTTVHHLHTLGYSDFDVFKENERGSHVYRCKSNSKNLSKNIFQNFETFLANRALKFQKSAIMT